LFKKWERIPSFSNDIGLFICEFKIRGLLLERIYREFRGPPVHSIVSTKFIFKGNNIMLFIRSFEVKVKLSNLILENDENRSCGKFTLFVC